jgi:hypothetical protein
VIDEVVEVAEALPAMEASRHEWHVARITIEAGTARPRTAVFLAMDPEAMEMYVTPGEDNLQRGMEAGQRHVTADEELAPDEGADALHDHTELIDIG